MPLTGTAPILSAAIKADLLADPASGAIDGDALEILCSAIATRVIAHIVANALVTVPLGVEVQVVPLTGTGATVAPGLGTVA